MFVPSGITWSIGIYGKNAMKKPRVGGGETILDVYVSDKFMGRTIMQ